VKDFAGKVAFITGGASGIGLGMAEVFAEAGMKIVIADIRQDALERATAFLSSKRAAVHALRLDVTDRVAWVQAADAVEKTFGGVDILCNNAGIALPPGPIPKATYADWDFCLGVNLGGVINGVHTIVPRMIARAKGGHVVNTASLGGLMAGAGEGIYTTAKYAVAGLTEELRSDLAPYNIGVSLLCPGPTQTELFVSSTAVRPSDLNETGYVRAPLPGAKPGEPPPMLSFALQPAEVGRRVLNGIKRDDLFIITHSEFRHIIKARCDALLAAIPNDTVSPERKAFSEHFVKDTIYAEQIAKPAP
jgi:NAD(P)-dependent dehydrogenase (short-subunit alcohol dehydrogenase family)